MTLYTTNEKERKKFPIFYAPIEELNNILNTQISKTFENEEGEKSKEFVKRELKKIFENCKINLKDEKYNELIKKASHRFGVELKYYKNIKSFNELIETTYQHQTNPSPLEKETIRESREFNNSFSN